MLQPTFLALDVGARVPFDPTMLEVLTPKFMHWHGTQWLLDLNLCLPYWQQRAAALGTDLNGLWLQVLAQNFGASFQAVLASQAWHAALMLTYVQERELHGLIDTRTLLGRKLLQEVTWSTWWLTAERAEPHILPQTKTTKAATFKRQSAQMRRAVGRLNLARPWQLHTAEPLSMQRRFGSTLARLWGWTYFNVANDFPWQSCSVRNNPKLQRHLDFPLLDWAPLEPLLRDDFNKLCETSNKATCLHAQEKVVRIAWRLTLMDLQQVVIPIVFRNPHSLHKDAPEHKISLLQAFYAFQAHLKAHVAVDQPIPQPIIHWELEVEERFLLPTFLRSLFAGETSEISRLEELENMLPIALERYETTRDWLPEDSFIMNNPEPQPQESAERCLPFAVVAKKRPLFILRQPKRLTLRPTSSGWFFLERTMTKWWKNAQPELCERDYYRLVDNNGKAMWVFQDSTRQWYLHGIFA